MPLSDSLFEDRTQLLIRAQYLGHKVRVDTISLPGHWTFTMQREHFELDPVVVTGEYGVIGAQRAVNRIRVIDRKAIERASARDLTDLLSHQGNIRLSQESVVGTGISLQGLGDNKVKILVDGVPVVGRINGSIDLGQFDLQDVERIEIVEGPMAVSYGTDALAGVINIISERADDRLKVRAQGYAESIGQYDMDVGVSTRSGKWQITADLARNFFDGWKPGDQHFVQEEPIADNRRVDAWNQKEQYRASLKIGRSWKKLNARYSLRLLDEELKDRGMPDISPWSAFAFDYRYSTRRMDQSLHLDAPLGDRWQFDMINAYNLYEWRKNRYFIDLETLDTRLTPEDHDTTSFDALRFRGTVSTTNREDKIWDLQLGYDVGHDMVRGQRIEGNPEMSDLAIFASFRYRPIKGLVLSPGFRASHNTAFKTSGTPSFHLRYTSGKTVWRASYGKGFRAPTFKELYLDFVDVNHFVKGNDQLRAERSDSYNFSVQRRGADKDRTLRISLNGYYNKVKEQIELIQSGPQTSSGAAVPFTYVNLSELETYGARIESELRKADLGIRIGAGIGGMRLQTLGVKSALSPQVNLGFDYHFSGLKVDLALDHSYQGEQLQSYLQEEDEVVLFGQDAYHISDISIGRAFLEGRFRLDLGVRNLMDVTSVDRSRAGGIHDLADGQSLIGTGRSYFGSLKWIWKGK